LLRTATIAGVELVEWAVAESKRLLSEDRVRWLHVRGVAELASQVGPALPQSERPVLMAAAFLHDIGYSLALRSTSAHQLDGARYLRSYDLERLACLVAHHSEARFEIEARGLGEDLATFEREESAVSEALTYCDMLTGPSGKPVSLQDRIGEVERRYRSGPVVDALKLAGPALLRAIRRTEERRAAGPQPM
jgi:hypothetical protein